MFLMKFRKKFHKTALFLAVENNNIEIVKLLLEHKGIDVNIVIILK